MMDRSGIGRENNSSSIIDKNLARIRLSYVSNKSEAFFRLWSFRLLRRVALYVPIMHVTNASPNLLPPS
jgi:hypothetical protein